MKFSDFCDVLRGGRQSTESLQGSGASPNLGKFGSTEFIFSVNKHKKVDLGNFKRFNIFFPFASICLSILSFYLSIYLVNLSIYLSCPSIYLSILSIHLSCPSICLSCPSIYLSCPSIYLFCPSIYLFVHLYLSILFCIRLSQGDELETGDSNVLRKAASLAQVDQGIRSPSQGYVYYHN